MTQKIVLDAVEEVLDGHSVRLGIPQTESPVIKFWHLMVSLLEFSEEHGIDFDLEVDAAREHLKEMEL